jgi:hypothetical protein
MGSAFSAALGPRPTNPNPAQGPGQAFGAALGPAASAPDEFAPVIADVGKRYPALSPYLGNVVVRRGQTQDDRQLEYYAPWEGDNPNPGKNTVEIYNPDLKGDSLTQSVALDILHHVGGVDSNGKPVDPKYYALKQQLMAAIKQANRPMDQEAYQQDLKAYPDTGSYDQWLAHNRADAYIRAMVSPEMNPEWNQPGMFTPAMKSVGDQINQYLRAPPPAAGDSGVHQ